MFFKNINITLKDMYKILAEGPKKLGYGGANAPWSYLADGACVRNKIYYMIFHLNIVTCFIFIYLKTYYI